ncbi:hypothetical protein C8R44DRAFT_359975 [Mycena epipterygia]|nr:hypothetical protein C8R44DRAFT_359975 [Mycena epipterygia]
MCSEIPPSFPAELEREIFETAALKYPAIIPSLLIVARRVLAWIEPLLYKTIVIRTSWSWPRLPGIDSKLSAAPDFMRDNVRHLLCYSGHPISTLHDILSVCASIERLALYDYPRYESIVPHLAALSGLQRLNIRLGHQRINILRNSVSSTITHLDLLDGLEPGDLHYWMDLTLLPALIHVSLHNHHSPQILVQVLQGRQKLHALVNFCSYARPFVKDLSDKLSIDDPRFVLMQYLVPEERILDWTVGANEGHDFWNRADFFIAKRRRGEIDPDVCQSCCLHVAFMCCLGNCTDTVCYAVSRYWIEDCDNIFS